MYIQVVCPVCGAVLGLNASPDLAQKSIKCPNCKHINPFAAFREHTPSSGSPSEETEPSVQSSSSGIGRLTVPSLGRSFPLRLGKNIVGRESASSSADIRFPCANKRMSREHVLIEVRTTSAGKAEHLISLCKEKTNATYVNNLRIEYGDCVKLSNHDTIKFPEMDVLFEVYEEGPEAEQSSEV